MLQRGLVKPFPARMLYSLEIRYVAVRFCEAMTLCKEVR